MKKELIEMVVNQCGDKQYAIDAGNHGADAGWPGFTYNSDCIEFFDKNKDMIEEFIEESVEEFGYENGMELANTFGRKDMLTMGIDGYKVLMSWFILEEAGRILDPENK